MRNKNQLLYSMLALALALCVFAPIASADASGTLYFTTFNGDRTPNTTVTNVWSVGFTYVCGAGCGPTGTFVLGGGGVTPTTTAIFMANGADGLRFYPNNPNQLVVAGQNQNNVAQITTAGVLITNAKADNLATITPPTGDPQAFHLAVTPDNAFLLATPNTAGAGGTSIDVLPTNFGGTGIVGNGTAKTITGADTQLRDIAYFGNTAYYTTSNDNGLGNFGVLSNPTGAGNGTTAQVIVTGAGVGCNASGQGCLPSHGITFDPFSNSFFMVSKNQVWQLQQTLTSPNTWNVVSKFSGLANDVYDNASVDGLGHLFVADAGTGNILFIDYSSGAKLVGAASNFVFEHFLKTSLDDIVDFGGQPPPTVPEPTSILLFGTALALVGTVLRGRKAKG